MNLQLAYPKGRDQGDILFSLPFDINRNTRKIDGHCIITSEEIQIYIDHKQVEVYKIEQFEELVTQQLIGCSMLVGRKGEEDQFICAFTQTYFVRYAELCKVIEFYKRTGEWVTDTGEDEPTCSKCGLPMNGSRKCSFCTPKSQIITRMAQRIIPYKNKFLIAVVCTLLSQVGWLIMPYLKRIIVDEYIVPLNDDLLSFVGVSAVMVGLLIGIWIIEHLNMKMSFQVALAIGKDLRQEVFNKAQEMSMKDISKRTTGELINRISSDAAKIQDFITANGKDMIVRIFSIIVLTVVLVSLNPKLAVMVLLPVPFVLMISWRVFNFMGIRYGRVWRMRSRYSSLLHDILNGIRVVKSYGNEKREIEKFKEASLNWKNSAVKAEIVWYLTVPFSWFILSIGNFLVLYLGGKMVLGQTLTLGELIQYTSYVAMIYEPLHWLMQLPRILSDASVSATRVFEILDEECDVADKEGALQIDIKGNIKFDDVYFGYKVHTPVLKGITGEIKEGEMVGIVGHSGVGKSTLINLILRLYDTTQGSVQIDGVDIKDIAQESLRSQVGVVLQETFLFDGNVYDNIRYAKPDATFEEIIKAAKVAYAHDFIVKLPDGYNTRVGDKGHSLSGGERQRIAIARAILHNPKILILDEATASLDTQTEKQIQDALNKLIKGRTTIAIAHRLSTLSSADKLIVLDKGKVAEIGAHDQLMRNKNVYYKLVMAQRQTTKMKKIKATQ